MKRFIFVSLTVFSFSMGAFAETVHSQAPTVPAGTGLDALNYVPGQAAAVASVPQNGSKPLYQVNNPCTLPQIPSTGSVSSSLYGK